MLPHRLIKLRKHLVNHSLNALLISTVPNIIYLTNFSNFSTEEREAYLFITPNHQYILTDGRYTTAVKKEVQDFELIEIGIKRSKKQVFEELAKKHAIKILSIEEDNLTVAEYNMLQSCYHDLNHSNIEILRIKKDKPEIMAIEKACSLGDRAFGYILKHIKPGITEKQLSWELEKFIREHDADISFKPIIALNENAAVPHHQTGETKLGNRGIILLDFGIKIQNYCSDMTRTVFLGKATDEQKKIYQTVHDSQQKAIDYINNHPSPNASAVDKAARDYITSKKFPPIPHSLGHGIGLEVHEPPTLSPNSKQTLEEGMIFSIEPGIYLPNHAGVRIEDLFVIEKTGLRQLTKSPKHLIEL